MQSHLAFFFFLLVCTACVTLAQASAPTTVRRHNYGVIFQANGVTYPNSGVWSHTFHITLPMVSTWPTVSDWCVIDSFKQICSEFPGLTTLVRNFTNNTQHQFRQSLHQVYDLLRNSPLPSDLSKRKRSLLPFIGRLSSSLFGTASEDDVRLVESHVQAISKSQSGLLSGFQRHTQLMSSFISLSQERMNNFDTLLKQQYDSVISTLVSDRQWIEQHDSDLSFVLYKMFSAIYDAVPLQNQVQTLSNALEKLVAGFLPSSFISPSTLRQTIDDIDHTLLESRPDVRVLHQDPSYYYTQHDFLYLRNDSDLYITLKFPMSSHQVMTLAVYTVIIFPVHFHNASDFSTLLQSSVQSFFLSDPTDYFAESTQLSSPTNRFSVDILVPNTNPSCLFAIFHDQSADIKTLCQFQVFPSAELQTDLFVLDYPQILIRHAPSVKVICRHRIRSPPSSCSYCFYSVPCACAVQTPRAYLPPRISQCEFDDENLPVTDILQFPVNLALLHHFFSNDTLAAFSGDTLLNRSLAVQLPPMKFYNHSFDDKLATSHSLTYKLDRVVNASKADQQIFRSIIDPVLSGDLSIPSNFFFTPPGYLVVATTAGTLSNFLITSYLAYRLRLCNAALAVLAQQLPRTHAMNLPNLVATLPPSSTASSFLLLTHTQDPSAWFGYLVLIILLIYIVHKFCNCRHAYFHASPDFDICMEVKVNGSCFFLTLQKVPGCPSDYITTGTTLCESVTLSGWFNPHLNVVWADFAMKHRMTNTPVYLDSHFKISLFQRFKMRSVFNDHYALLLFFDHAGKGLYVSL
jgi:hypothetical protein